MEAATPAAPGPPALHADELEALRRLALRAFATVHPDEVFAALCAELRPLLGADFVAASHRAFGGRRQWSGDGEPEADAAARVSLLLARARDGGEPLVVAAAPDGPHADGGRLLPPSPGLAAAVAVPLRVAGGEPLGALAAGWTAAAFPPRAPLLVEAAAELAAVAFQNAARYDEMQQAALRRDRFFSAMSHDLRTPITAIVGYGELLQDGIFGELSGKQQEMIDRICLVAGQLSQLLNDVMDLAKLDAGRMEFHREPVRLGELVDEAIVSVEPQAQAKGLFVALELGEERETPLRIDPPRVRQILVNLLSNAVKFTERGEVRVRTGVEDGRRWLEVRDTGPGLPAGSEERVFEEFLQIAAGTRGKNRPGAGLGLAISRRLARAMGGDLVARSTPGEGASFTLHLPPDDDA